MNWLDFAILGIVALSALIGLRGATREVLTLGAWPAAVILTLLGLPFAQAIARQFIAMRLAADIVAGVVLFIALAIVLNILCHRLAALVRGSALSSLDRLLGVGFGVARGVVVVAAIQYAIAWGYRDAAQPDWIARSALWPQLEAASSAAMDWLGAVGAPAAGGAEDEATERGGRSRLTDAMEGPRQSPDSDVESDTGYREDSRQDLERLIETTE